MYKFKTPLHKFILRKLRSSNVHQELAPHFTYASIQSFWFAKTHQKAVILLANLLHYCFVWKSFLWRIPIDENIMLSLVVLADLDIYNGFALWSLGIFWALQCSHWHYSWLISGSWAIGLAKLLTTADSGWAWAWICRFLTARHNLMASELSSSWWFVELSFLPVYTYPGIRWRYFELL